MAKKKANSEKSFGIFGFVKDIIKNVFSLGDVIENIKEHINAFLDKSIKKVTAATIMIVGVIFLVIGTFYFLLEHLHLSKTTIFLGLGILLIFISYVMKYNIMKEDH